MEEKPENFFNIEDSESSFLDGKEETQPSSSSENVEEMVIEKRDMTIDDLKSLLQKNNVTIDEKTIENYYNQIVENKSYVNEYNTAISELEAAKQEFSEKKEKGKTSEQDPFILKKLDELEEKLADLNVEKQKKEDEIKSVINNIFNEDTENVENKNFEVKNETLNMSLNGVQEEKKKEESQFLEEETTTEPVEEEMPLGEEITKEPVEEEMPLGEEITKEPVEEEMPLGEEITKEPVEEEMPLGEEITKEPVEEKEFLGLNKEDLKENIEEKPKNKTEDGISSLAETMKKGFDNVLNAIKGIKNEKNEKTSFEGQEQQPQQEIQQGGEEAQESVKDKEKIPQANYLEEYKDSLRSNSPIGSFVGIKDIEFKANNIGSYT
jgi:hypothetical protein